MERSPDVEGFVREMYDLMRAGDGAAVASLVPDDEGVLFVGTDAEEWWDTTGAIRGAMQEQLEATGGFDFVDIDPRGYRAGDVGWFSDHPSMRFPDGSVVPMRMTGVARMAGGSWQLVQGHLSVAASANEQLFE